MSLANWLSQFLIFFKIQFYPSLKSTSTFNQLFGDHSSPSTFLKKPITTTKFSVLTIHLPALVLLFLLLSFLDFLPKAQLFMRYFFVRPLDHHVPLLLPPLQSHCDPLLLPSLQKLFSSFVSGSTSVFVSPSSSGFSH